MKEGWEIKKLVELGKIQTGTTPSTRNKEFYGNYIPFVKPPHFSLDGTINYKKEGLSEIGLNKGRLIKENSILMVCIGATIGKTGITSKPVSCNQQINAFTPKKGLEPKYFYYLLSSSIFFKQVMNLASQATLPMINKTKWQNIEVSYPKSLKQQQQIVAILDKAFTAIDKAKANAQQNLLNAKQLFESYLQNVFTNKGEDWEEKEWNELIEIRSGRNQKEVLNPNGKYPILGSAGKVMNYADKYICEANTTIIGRKGTINNPLFITTRFWNVDTAFGLHVGDKLKNKFLYYFCKSFDFTQMDKGSGRPSLVKTDLLKIKLSFPSISEQKEIINKIDDFHSQTKKLETIYQQKMVDLKELKKSVLQKAFNGELTQKELV